MNNGGLLFISTSEYISVIRLTVLTVAGGVIIAGEATAALEAGSGCAFNGAGSGWLLTVLASVAIIH